MFCTNCGKQLPEGASFCPACGNALDRSVSSHDTHSANLDYRKNDPTLNMDAYRRMFNWGYIVDAIVTLCILAVWILLEPINLNPYFFEEVFNWPVIIGGILAMAVASSATHIVSNKKATDRLLSDIELAGKQMMWRILQTEKPLFETIRVMDLNTPATNTIKEIIFSTSICYFDTTLDDIINNGCDSYVGYVLPDGDADNGSDYYIFGGYAYVNLGVLGGNVVSDNIFSADPSPVLDVTLTDPSAFPSNTQLIDTEYYLDIAEHDYSYNRSWIDDHAGQWVRIDSLISDIRMMDSTGQYPELYCFLDYSEDFGLENYGDFRVIGWDNMICIPLADGMSENYYMYLIDDGYGVMGINAQAVEGDIPSDPTGPNGEPLY